MWRGSIVVGCSFSKIRIYTCYCIQILLGEREQAHLVVQPARYIIPVSRIFLFHHSTTGKLEARLLQVQRSSILPPCISQFYARLSFSATCDKSSSTDNNCPSTLQHLLNGTPYGYLHIRYQPRCVKAYP